MEMITGPILHMERLRLREVYALPKAAQPATDCIGA